MQYMIIFALVLVPLFSSAATYHYVNTEGTLATIEAPTADEAIQNAPNRMSNSGVALDMGVIQTGTQVNTQVTDTSPLVLGTGGSNTYHYVTSAGLTALVTAPDVDTALRIAPNRASNSGVAINVGLIQPGSVVQGAQ